MIDARADGDGDGVPDGTDNCPGAANPDQGDLDGDGQGDACDDDDDADGIADAADNCPRVANPDQANLDGDAAGDACDDDDDGDGVADATDNCPRDANGDQANHDTDANGDACDDDDDDDTLLDAVDNCPIDANLDQADFEMDGLGDACDPDDDNDTIADLTDNCPHDPNPDQANHDTDANGDACDDDDDDDTVLDAADNCPIDANLGQEDTEDGPPIATATPFALRPAPVTVAVSGDDAISAPLPIGFPFLYFGTSVTEFNVSTNGFITFGDVSSNGCCAGGPIPSTGSPNGVVALYWVDLITSSGSITWGLSGTAPDRELVVSWNAVPHYSGAGQPVTGQIILHESSNSIEIVCATCVSDGRLHTQGAEDLTGTTAVFMTGRVEASWSASNDAVLISPQQLGDGVGDACDNCADLDNADQADGDTDGVGTVCDICPAVADPAQLETDGDGVGDGCDNCPLVSNASQADGDNDGMGDACDDRDGDTVFDAVDNCPTVANANQADGDSDGHGDLCDNCPMVSNASQADGDNDGVGDACEDSDGDTVFDAVDNCPTIANANQADTDSDGRGNLCDNCQTVANPNQVDSDSDGIGDACDGLDPTLETIIPGGGIVAAGVGWAGRSGGGSTSTTINLTGIPAGAMIVSATAYWMTIGGADDSITINGMPVTGTQFATAPDTCWGRPEGNFAFRANLASLVTGDGAYVIAGYPSNPSGLDGQGLTLLVVYRDPADPRMNLVQVAEGAIGYLGGGGTGVASTRTGFTVGPSFDDATVINVVGDGQPFPEELFVNNTQLGGADPFGGADGAFWDTRRDDVTSLVSAGATQVETRLASSNDCLAWIVNALVITDMGSMPTGRVARPRPVAITPDVPAPVVRFLGRDLTFYSGGRRWPTPIAR